jgi:hypothetical protein
MEGVALFIIAFAGFAEDRRTVVRLGGIIFSFFCANLGVCADSSY